MSVKGRMTRTRRLRRVVQGIFLTLFLVLLGYLGVHKTITAALDGRISGIERELGPGGFNVGINDGPAAGQTVMHMHVHLIPRFVGDCLDPRGGVRWVLPERARYWD